MSERNPEMDEKASSGNEVGVSSKKLGLESGEEQKDAIDEKVNESPEKKNELGGGSSKLLGEGHERTVQAALEMRQRAKEAARKNIQGSQIIGSIWLAWLCGVLLIVALYKLYNQKELYSSLVFGTVMGFAATGIYYQNRKWKEERNQRLAMIPGKKGAQALLHHIPNWLSFSDVEKMEWLNRIVEQAWPYYDKAICEEVKQQVEPMMDEYRPPFIKKIWFKKLTFGDSPFRVENIRVDDSSNDKVDIEVGFRWSGDASIFLAIELVAGGSATRMVPKVTDLAVSGQAKISLAPLLPEIPGFGAATVSLMRPPNVKFHLDFGAAFGGSMSAKAVIAWLDPFLRETITGMLVWPRRIVVPVLPIEVTGPLDELYLRHKGALEIDVISATNLPKMDRFGSCDPYLELFVDPNGDMEKTSTKKNTLSPEWNEKHWLLVQEPQTQHLHLRMFDIDMLNARELFRINVIKGATSVIGSSELVGRGEVAISNLYDRPGLKQKVTVLLGPDEFNNPSGCGSGRGEVKLNVTYWPLEKISGHAECQVGALLVTLIRARNLPIADVVQNSSDPYVLLSCAKIEKKSPTLAGTCSPEWPDCKFEWFKIPLQSVLIVKVFDYDKFSKDDLLGSIKIPIKEVALSPGGDLTKSFKLETEDSVSAAEPDRPSEIDLRLQWVPFKEITLLHK